MQATTISLITPFVGRVRSGWMFAPSPSANGRAGKALALSDENDVTRQVPVDPVRGLVVDQQV